MQNAKTFDHLRHYDDLMKAHYWPGWIFLPHGLDKDPKVLLSKKAWGIVFYDRQLVCNERRLRSEQVRQNPEV